MFPRVALLAALLGAVSAQNSSDYATELLKTLDTLNLTRLSGAIKTASSDSTGAALINALADESKNYTVFAPNNAGFEGAFPNATSTDTNIPGLVNTLAYHVVFGSYPNLTQTYPNTTVGRTALNAPSLVQLEGNKSQVLAWSRWPTDNKVHVLNQNTNVTVTTSAVFRNLQVNVIDAVLDTPGNLSNALDFYNLSTLETVLKAVPTTYQGESVTLFELLNTRLHGYTLFAPSDSAFAAAASAVAGLQSNATALTIVLANHLLNGTTIYSPTFSEQNATTAAGQLVYATQNGTSKYLTASNGDTASIVTPDIILANGVVHIIDRVFANTNLDTGAASSAVQSATSAAGTAPSTTETAPVGITATAVPGNGNGGNGGSGGNGGGSSQSPSAGMAVRFDMPIMGMAMAAVAAVVGGVVTMA